MDVLIKVILCVSVISTSVFIIIGIAYFIYDVIDKYLAAQKCKIMMRIAKMESDDYIQELIKKNGI